MTTDLRDKLQSTLGSAYTVEKELGGGGMSRVFLAEEVRLRRQVVVKVLTPQLAIGISAERFEREILLAAQLQHPHIVPLLSAGGSGDLLFYTMPEIRGESLGTRLRREGALPVGDTVRILRDVADALAYAHGSGVVHRDIKPDNVLLTGQHAVVTDFGVAKALSEAGGEPSLTSTGIALGTPAYMAPEQVVADPHVDHRADIYAVGVLAYEMLAGVTPFSGASAQAMLAAHVTAAPEPLSRHRPIVSPALEELVMRCLEKNPADRWQSSDELLTQLGMMSLSGSEQTAPRSTARSDRRAIAAAKNGKRARQPSVRMIAAGALLAVLLVAGYTLFRDRLRHTALWVSARDAEAPGRDSLVESSKSIAVLPFVNMSAARDNEYFSDGMTEELINALARIQGLHVAARTSAFAFKGKNQDIGEIAKKLRVGTVLEGSVRHAGNRLKVTAQLIDAKSGYHLWSETYDREMSDVFAVQEEIARAIVNSLKLRLPGGSPVSLVNAGTTDPEAHNLYLRGRYAWNKRTPEGLQQAVKYFQQAIERDAGYAPAYSGLADTYITLFDYDLLSLAETTPKARAAATRALEIDPTLAEAHTSLAHLHLHDWNWTAAEREFKRAIELDSGYAPTYHWYALSLTTVGRLKEAVAAMTRAQHLDPLSLRMNADLGMAYYAARQYDRAIEQERKTLELEPNAPVAHWIASMAYEQKGLYAEAQREVQQALAMRPGNPNYLAALARVHALAGRRTEARKILDDLEEKAKHGAASPFFVALVYTALGERDSAFDWLERAYQERSGSIRYLKMEPRLDVLRSDPRYRNLMRRVGLPE